jgi:phospholipid-binding lipoprotein MlaA
MEARMTHRRMATDRQPTIDAARIQAPSVRFSSSLLLTRWLPAASVLLALLVAGCATPMPRKDDPYESFNRKMYAFNDFADRVAIRPVAVGYRKITNDTSRRLISNFFANIESPITIANDLLQVNVKEALKATSRLAINSTIGVLGIFDPASELSIEASETDFGVTLAKWGVPEGPYLVLPLFGSTNPRDMMSYPIDRYLFDPLSWYSASHSFQFDVQFAPTFVYLVTLRSSAIDAEGLLEGAYDPYVFYRDAYRQRRLYKIYRGNPPMEAIQFLQGVEDVDVDALLQEQEKYEQKKKDPNKQDPDKPSRN